jgi:hypothetical protein
MSSIFNFHISISDSLPLIWRSLEIDAQSSFVDLHDSIQVLMDWTEEKSFYFEIGNLQIADPEMFEEADANIFEAKLNDYITEIGFKLEYYYKDEAGSWLVEIVLESENEPEQGLFYPNCNAGEGRAPVETLSGIAVYNEYIEIYGQPEHEFFAIVKQVFPEPPTFFNKDAINGELQSIFAATPIKVQEIVGNDDLDPLAQLLLLPQLEMSEKQLEFAKKVFDQYKKMGEKALLQIPDEALFWQANEESNSIATIVKHLWGNMLSRWTDFLTSDGEKEWRERDEEFENDLKSRKVLMEKWEEGWKVLFMALDELEGSDWGKTVYIRKEPHLVWQAVQRQMMHYAYHIGQIVFLCKMLSQNGWETLSIPKRR